MKKLIALLLAVVMVLGLCACSVSSGSKKTEITLWTYPVGQWGDQATVEKTLKNIKKKLIGR